MDSTHIIIPTIICLTFAVILYRSLNSKKKSNKTSDKSIKNEENKENEIKPKNLDKKKEIGENIEKNEEIEVNKEEEIEDNKGEEIEKEKENKKELTYNAIFDKFCDYIQKNKLVSIESISIKLNKTKEDTIKFLRELENEGKMVGFLGADGEYFYLSTKELDLLNNLLLKSKNKQFKEEELEKQFQQIAKEGEKSIL